MKAPVPRTWIFPSWLYEAEPREEARSASGIDQEINWLLVTQDGDTERPTREVHSGLLLHRFATGFLRNRGSSEKAHPGKKDGAVATILE